MIIGILGLGEAGSAFAADLRDKGVTVRGYDPLARTQPDAPSESAAVDRADLVLSLTTATEAMAAAKAALPALREGQVYADLNTSGARLKVELADLLLARGVAFADVALMAPVPNLGITTPMVASGAGAQTFADRVQHLGMQVQVLEGPPGEAASRKLLRSVAWKGVATVVIEALEAARAAGQEDWMRDQLATILPGADLDRMVSGSATHAARREHEMEDVVAQLRELGVQPRMSDASRAWLKELRERG